MRRNWLVRLALCVALLGLVYGIGAGALWDGPEVGVAELGRRIALNLLGGKGLSLVGMDNSVPIRADLGRGELPFTSVALGLRVFGLSAWAARLPLLLWALLGLAGLHAALSRIWDRRTGHYAVLVLATMPLYLLQARTLTGDAVTLAAFALSWSGLSVACFADQLSTQRRLGFALLGALGLYAGFWCRGPIVSVAVPAFAVGLPGLVRKEAARRWRLFAGGLTALGVLALGLGVAGAWLALRTGEYSVFVGSALVPALELPTFDVPLGQLVHGAFPWSGAAPLALVLVARGRAGSAPRPAEQAAALGLALSLAASAWLTPLLGDQVLPGACLYAVLLAVALRAVERGELGSPLLGLVVAACVIVVGFDLHENPDKALSGLALAGASLPESLDAAGSALWLGGAAVLAVASALLLFERAAEPGEAPPRFERAEYGRVLSGFQRAWDGNLVFALLLLEAMLVGFLLLSAVSERLVPLPQLEGFGSFWRKAVLVLALALPLLPLLPLAAMLLRDGARALARRARSTSSTSLAPTRAEGLLLAFTAVGALGSLGFYPAFAREVSPKEALARYSAESGGGEPLALLGERSGAARYQGAPEARTLADVQSALDWLLAGPKSERRWLVLPGAQLPELNALYREARGKNLPLLDTGSSQMLLATNRLPAGEHNQSPLERVVLTRPPPIQHPVHAVLDGRLEVLGWSVTTADGTAQTSIAPAERYRFSIYYRVLSPLKGSWQTFVHLDGLQRRFNADHEPLEGQYPLRLWRQNDVIVDGTDLLLEPNFSPGSYRVYFGLFVGERRLAVTEGPASDDRVAAGSLQVR